MANGTEVARLARVVDELVAGVNADLRARRLSVAERRALKTEVEAAVQKLDELRSRLTAS